MPGNRVDSVPGPFNTTVTTISKLADWVTYSFVNKIKEADGLYVAMNAESTPGQGPYRTPLFRYAPTHSLSQVSGSDIDYTH